MNFPDNCTITHMMISMKDGNENSPASLSLLLHTDSSTNVNVAPPTTKTRRQLMSDVSPKYYGNTYCPTKDNALSDQRA